MNHSAQRRVGVIALAIGSLLITGCASGAPPQAAQSPTPVVEPGTARRSPSPSPTPTERRAPSDLSLDHGADLDPSEWRVQWFTFGDGFSELSPDDGNGSWSITDDATQCEISFYQGTLAGIDYSQDDRTITNELLTLMVGAISAGATREDVESHAFDDAVPLFFDDDVLPMRTIWGGQADGGTWLFSARMFGSMGGGIYLMINCPEGQDAMEEYNTLRDDEHLVVDVGPGST
ncbi:hypothetical protein ACH3VR_07100 [Microbacterium sp. B2969]|uniref:Lipoprotein n=1 Tax=Microbacterium alkaliflavum TaxID=3248839 RepID=A0ABW7Q5I8_9MICO